MIKNMPVDDSRFLVSGFENDVSDIDDDRNPDETNAKQLLKAAENGNLKKVQSLIESHLELVNVADKEGYTALHRACYGNHSEIVKYLLQKGANLNAQTEYLWQPLHSCCRWGSKECAAILIAEGADVNAASQGGQTPLHIAASHGACYDTVQLLLMHSYIKPELKNNSGETASDLAKRGSKYSNVFNMADPLINCITIQ